MLTVEHATCGYRAARQPDKVILEDISFHVNEGEVLCLLGVNGVGKTTLFKSILGAIPLLGGAVRVDGRALHAMSRREAARRIGYVPQSHAPPFPFTVEQVVVMGRSAHLPLLSTPGEKDYHLAAEALETMGIASLAQKVYTQISGGERQLVLIARALTQQAQLLIMDEPTSNLDFGNQLRVLRCMKELAQRGFGVVFTTHHPDQAFLCATKAAVLRGRGELVMGEVDEIITEETLRVLYGADLRIIQASDPAGNVAKAVLPFL